MFVHNVIDLINDPEFYLEITKDGTTIKCDRYDSETIPSKYLWEKVLCIGTYYGIICISI